VARRTPAAPEYRGRAWSILGDCSFFPITMFVAEQRAGYLTLMRDEDGDGKVSRLDVPPKVAQQLARDLPRFALRPGENALSPLI
jgi:hypothetical protein